jgi:hypothetical protein
MSGGELLGGVFVVGEVVAPFGVAFGDGEMRHERGWGGAVPVPFARRGDDDVTDVGRCAACPQLKGWCCGVDIPKDTAAAG